MNNSDSLTLNLPTATFDSQNEPAIISSSTPASLLAGANWHFDEGAEHNHLGTKFTFEADTIIDLQKTKVVYRGTLALEDPTLLTLKSQVVICKLTWTTRKVSRAQNEAKFYRKLRDLQGKHMANSYGFFTGTINGEEAACLLLEDCGSRVPANCSDDLE